MGGTTFSALCDAVIMTPTVLPSSLLLRRPASMPTRNKTESKIVPLYKRMSHVKKIYCVILKCHEPRRSIMIVDIREFGVSTYVGSERAQSELGHDHK